MLCPATREGRLGLELGVAHFPSKVALRDHIDAYIAHWNDDPTPFIWTKPAASIIRARNGMLDRIPHAVHTAPLAKTLMWEHVGSEAGRSSSAQTRRVTHAEDYRRRHGFHGWRHASTRRADRGSNQGLQVRRLGDALFRSRVRRRTRPPLQGEIRPPPRPQDLRDFRRVLALLRRPSSWRHRQAVQPHQEVSDF